jgi:HEAT repeat protein
VAEDRQGDATSAELAIADPVPEVRAAAAAAWGALARDDAVDALAPMLSDASEQVRVTAMVALFRHGGIEGGIVAGAELGRLLASADRGERRAAAGVLRHLGPSAYRPLRRLLGDPDPTVRRAALRAAVGVADPRLVPVLLDLLRDPASRARAGKALVAVGGPAVEPLCATLDDHATPRAARLAIPRLLRRIPHPDTYERMAEHVGTPDSHLRLRVLSALSELRAELHLPPAPLAQVRRHVEREIAETYRNLLAWNLARARFPSPLFDEELELRQARAGWRVLAILELRYDRHTLRLVRDRMRHAARRANALEVLDTLLDPPLRPLVMPFMDEGPPETRLKRAAEIVGQVPEPIEFLREQCRHQNPYVVLLALDALRRHDGAVAADLAATLLNHPEPLVREGALLAAGRPLPEGQMYSTLEKVLLLKRAPLFERVAGEDLAPLARVAETERLNLGDTLFKEGDVADALFLIVRGRVRVERGGREVAVLGAGEALGEMAVLDRVPRSATATALEETEVLCIASDEFYESLHEQSEIAEGVIRIMCQRLRAANDRLATNDAPSGH